jgi:hypothetical protein
MDTAILSATSALVRSLIGAISTLAASWLTLRGRLRAQALVEEAAKREALYAEFIIEASRRLSEAWSRQAESPEVLAGLYSAHQRMRLTSSDEVIRVADHVIRLVGRMPHPIRHLTSYGSASRRAMSNGILCGGLPRLAGRSYGPCAAELSTLSVQLRVIVAAPLALALLSLLALWEADSLDEFHCEMGFDAARCGRVDVEV